MKKPDVFVSFSIYDHEKQKDQFIHEPGPYAGLFNVLGWSQPEGADYFRDVNIVKNCNILIALVGRNTYMPGNVVTEVRMANGNNVPVFGVYLFGVGSPTPPPAGLHKSRMLSWLEAPDRVERMVALCLREGKNLQGWEG